MTHLSALNPYLTWLFLSIITDGAGGRVPPDTSHREISDDLPGKERQGKRENREEKKENRKREGRKLNMEGGKVTKWGGGEGEDLLFFFFFFFCFAFHFSKPLKFVLGLPKWEFSTRKKHFTPGKKIRKNDFAPSEKYSSYAPTVFLVTSYQGRGFKTPKIFYNKGHMMLHLVATYRSWSPPSISSKIRTTNFRLTSL